MWKVRGGYFFFVLKICSHILKTKSAIAIRSATNKRSSSHVTMQIPPFRREKTLRMSEGNRLPFKVCLARRLLYHVSTKIVIMFYRAAVCFPYGGAVVFHYFLSDAKQQQNHNTQYNAVNAECTEIMLFNVAHQEFDYQYRHGKRNRHTNEQNHKLGCRKIKSEF